MSGAPDKCPLCGRDDQAIRIVGFINSRFDGRWMCGTCYVEQYGETANAKR